MTLLFSFGSYAQNYVHIPDTNAIWSIEGNDFDNNWVYRLRFGIIGDTIIDNVEYHKVFSLYDSTLSHPQSTYYASIREENKRIYARIDTFPDLLLYDFNLHEGDTIHYISPFYISNPPGYSFCRIVEQIDSVQLQNGQYRRRYTLVSDINTCWHGDIWIEGIGSVYWKGLFNPLIYTIPLNGDGYFFSCFKQNDTVLYLNNPVCDQCFCTLYTYVIDLGQKNHSVNIFPNPFTYETRIIFENKDSKIYKMKIFDIKGCCMKSYNNIENGQLTIHRGNLKNGTYIYELATDKKVIKTGKLIIE